MGRQVVVKYAPLHSSLVNLPLSLYGPLVSGGVVHHRSLLGLGCSTDSAICSDPNPLPFICPMASRATNSSPRMWAGLGWRLRRRPRAGLNQIVILLHSMRLKSIPSLLLVLDSSRVTL
jgi:hypothetical protein